MRGNLSFPTRENEDGRKQPIFLAKGARGGQNSVTITISLLGQEGGPPLSWCNYFAPVALY